MQQNLYSVFAQRFSKHGVKPALRLSDGRTYTFADLERESGRYAALLATLGLELGDRVCVQVEKSAPAVFLYLGCLRAGVIYVPLNPAYQRNEIEHFLSDAQPRLMVCRPQNHEWIAPLASAASGPHLLELADDGTGELAKLAESLTPTREVAEVEADDIAAILYTSGTTGRSKGAMLSHRNLRANTEVLHRSWEWRSEDVLLHVLPIFHVHGLFVALHGALYSGSTMLFETKFDPARTIAQLKNATVFMGVPTHYARLLSENSLDKRACANMRLFVSGSAPLLPATFEEFRERTGHTILERYGMTETNMLASNPYHGARVAGTVGLPLPGVEIRVVDDRDAPVEAETIGHVQVRGPNVFKGYWRRPDKNREEFTTDGFFRTGDLGQFNEAGYLSIVGRHKDLIITGGLNVYPKEIEAAIDAFPGVRESAVIGVPDADFGEAVTAVVIRSDPRLSADTLIAELKTRLANFKVPKRVLFVDELPRNTMGKVQKKELRARFS